MNVNSPASAITYKFLTKELEEGRLAPAYFFYGEEDYLIEQALGKIKQVAVEAGTEEFNWNVFRADADDMDWSLFADALTSLPLIPARRIVVLKRLDRALRNKSALQLIENAVRQPAPDLNLVLIQEEPPNLKKPFYGVLLKHARAVAFPHPRTAELQQHLNDYAAGFGKEISAESIERILTESEPGIRGLMLKLDVLISYLGDRTEIELSDVEQCTAFTREVEIFNLLESLGRRNTALSHRIVEQLIQRKVDIGMLVPLLYRQTWALYRMKYLQEQRVPNSKWSEHISIKPQFLERRYRQYLPNYSRKELGKALEVLVEVDTARKTTSVQNDYLLRTLTERLLAP